MPSLSVLMSLMSLPAAAADSSFGEIPPELPPLHPVPRTYSVPPHAGRHSPGTRQRRRRQRARRGGRL